MPLRSAWKAARICTSGPSASASRIASRSAWPSEEKGLSSVPASCVSQASSSPANPSRSAALGFSPTAIWIASGTPIALAEGRPSSPGTNVSQIDSRALDALPLSVRVTAACSSVSRWCR